LLEDREVIRFFEITDYEVTGIYTIRNSGSEYRATLGILLSAESTSNLHPEDVRLQFFVNNEKAGYTAIENDWSVSYENEVIETPMTSTCWALIDVIFPVNSVTTIEVRYVNDLYYGPRLEGARHSYSMSYNRDRWFHFPELLYWRGPTKFSVEVINDSRDSDNESMEYCWISNIAFPSVADNIRQIWYVPNVLHSKEYLQGLNDLDTNLMKISKKNGNTFQIEFKEEYFENYLRSVILFVDTRGRGGSPYFYFDSYSDNIILDFFHENRNIPYRNISKRELAPYELIFLTNSQLRVMRNAFYAQYGYIFRSEEIQNIIGLSPNPNFHEGMLTATDRANIAIIQRLEALARD
jgi:hypothetical protein